MQDTRSALAPCQCLGLGRERRGEIAADVDAVEGDGEAVDRHDGGWQAGRLAKTVM